MTKDEHDAICKKLADEGRLIEAGFRGLRFTAIPEDATPEQIEYTRMAFFAGAQHLFGSIMGILDSEREPTEKDLRRMHLINAELNEFIEQFKAKYSKSGGTA